VEVGSTVLGIGDHVRGGTRVFERDGNDRRRWAYGFSLGFILALSFDEQFVRTRDDQLEMLDQLRAALTEFPIDLPDALRGSDLAKDRWSQLAGAR
jgi:hypothetical protein